MSGLIARHPGGAWGGRMFVITLLALLIALPGLPKLRLDNDIESWITDSPGARKNYRDFRDAFGNDEFVIIAYRGKPLFDPTGLDEQLALADRVASLTSVKSVFGIPTVYRDLYGGEDADALELEFSGTPFYENYVVSADRNLAGMIVTLNDFDGPTGRAKLHSAIREALEPFEGAGWECHLAGPPILNSVIDETSRVEGRKIFPIAVVLSVATLVLLLRSLRATVAIGAGVAITVMITSGTMGWLGIPINMVTTVLPPLLAVLAMANGVHVFNHFIHRFTDATPAYDAMRDALTTVRSACTWSSVTTAAGFISLMAADMQPVRQLGIMTATGLMISLAVNLSVVPVLLLALNPRPRAGRIDRGATVAQVCLPRSQRSAQRRVAAFVVATVVAAGSIPFIARESNPLNYLPESHPTVADYHLIGEQLSGMYALEIALTLPRAWTDPEMVALLDDTATTLESLDGAVHVLSPVALVKKVNQWLHDFEPEYFALPQDAHDVVALAAELDPAALNALIRHDPERVRITVLMNALTSDELLNDWSSAERIIGELPDPVTGYATGLIPRLVAAQENLVRTQVKSFGLALCIILLCFAVALRDWRMVLLSIWPNVLPVLSGCALMALLHIPLDMGTVMVAGLALGIAVDDTMHYLIGYRENRRCGMSIPESLNATTTTIGISIITTTFTACLGFVSLILSQFIPISHFGLIAAVAILVALLSDLFLLPALLRLRGEVVA